MKRKILVIIPLLAALALICGCNLIKPFTSQNEKSGGSASNDNSNKIEQNSTALSINDYYPFNPDVKYTFQGKGLEYSSYTAWTDYIKGNRLQLRTNNGGTETVKVLENKDGKLTLIFRRDECYYREDFTSNPGNQNEILLQEPLAKGTSWSLSDGRKRYISNAEVMIETPSGAYKALEVTTEGSENKVLDYYAPQKGFIKTVFLSKGNEISSTLNKIENNSPFEQNVTFYYPNINDSKLYYKSIALSFKTNDITKEVLEKYLKEVPSKNLVKLLGPNAKINSLYLNKDNMVYVDFSKELVTEMNAGAGTEQLILQGIVNTLGSYYGVNKVYLTIENKPYSSGHFVFKKGQTFTVSTADYVQLKE